jgi:hypothetical protein
MEDCLAAEGAATNRSLSALAGATVLSGSLGSLHAFSVLLPALESVTSAGRASVSLVYSAAIASLTVALLFVHHLFVRVHPSRLVIALGLAGAAGLAVAAATSRLPLVILGYGIIFGASNGVGYGLSLERAGTAWPTRKGLAVGIVTAAYAGSAMLFSQVFASLAKVGDASAALLVLAASILAASAVAATLFARTSLPLNIDAVPVEARRSDARLWLLWSGYGCGAVAGLMVMAHAAAIVAVRGGDIADGAAGTAAVAAGNALGAFAAGWLTDRWSVRAALIAASALSTAAMLALTLTLSPAATIAGLGAVGVAYGGLIAVYPVAAIRFFGISQAPRAFGRIFTAWGIAGLIGPWLAGAIYDSSQSYDAAVLAAAAAAALCGGLSASLPRSDNAD